MQTRRQFINPLKASIGIMHSGSKILMNRCISVIKLVNICKNYIPNKYVTFSDKEEFNIKEFINSKISYRWKN